MNEYVIAEYIRLSVEDGITESLSIPSQRKILNQFIEELDIPNATVLEFVDNGFSGTMMERPALQEMLDLASNGGINCIIIKDLSRLSRNAPESSYLIERIFPFYRIRLISVNDNFDSGDYKETAGGLNVSFKYILHEHYSNDLSRKVKSAKRYKMEHGQNIVANTIYGYNKNNDGKWEPDLMSSEVVRYIFQMALEGLATSQIRDKLFAEHYPTPREYIDMKRGKEVIPQCMWTTRMALHILTNEQYTGSYISGKQESKKVGSHSKNWVDKSKWIIIPNNHPPIVSKGDFDRVQTLLEYRKGSTTVKPLQSNLSRPRRNRMVNGEFIAATPIYGYRKMDNGKWDIDEYAAEAIRKIYDMAKNGLSFAKICDKLYELGYTTPSEYFRHGVALDISSIRRWSENRVRETLKNEQYTGSYVSGKILKDYETGKSYHTSKNEWIVIPDKHPAIISKEVFNEVQEIIAKSRFKRRNVRNLDYLLRSLVVCGCCGYALTYDSLASYNVYRCHHTYVNTSADCHKMKINASELDNAVWSMIKRQAEVVLDDYGKFQIGITDEEKQVRSEYKNQLVKVEKKMKDCYESYRKGNIESSLYSALMNEYTQKIEMLNNHISILRKAERDQKSQKKSSDIAKGVLNEYEISRKIIDELIEKVYVFPGNQIKIDWKVADFASIE